MGVVYPRVAKIYQGRQCRWTGPSGRQCRRTAPLAPGRRASAHEQGAGALRFGPNGAVVGGDGERPTSRSRSPAARGAAVPPDRAVGAGSTRVRPMSRGRARCASVRMGRRCGQTAASPRAGACRLRRRWATLPCPAGKGRCRCAGVDAVCPAGKGAAEWRAGSWRIAGESGGSKRFAHQGTFPARRGTGTSRVSPPGTEIRALSQTERALLPATSSAVSDAASCKHASPPSLFAANIRRMRPTPASFARKLPTFRPSRRRLIPKPSRGETGGLCPHPLKGPDP